ncbi:hypothetical protein [uncultured Leifsonia sp.]|uniref:hypothetical protein n=1 Tax=uncultured Leifsonia sp. TaxID=340359 RepID=UPI0025F6C7F1|nr:hypothetical protein [uncultured Leifsonia sp.]
MSTSETPEMTDDPWETSSRDSRPRWWREWPVLAAVVPASVLAAAVTWARVPESSFWPLFGASAGILAALSGGLVVYRAFIGARFARVQSTRPDALVFEATRSPAADAVVRGLSSSRGRPAHWSVIAADMSGVYWYLGDPLFAECISIAARDIVGLKPTSVRMRDGYGGRQVPAILVEVRGAESWSVPIVPRSAGWSASFRYAASAADRDVLLVRLRRQLGVPEVSKRLG